MATDPDTPEELAHKARQFGRVRQALGYLGLGLPVALLGATLLFGDPLPASISDYYHTRMGDVLVGVLWAIGVFLLTYLGHPRSKIEINSGRFWDKITDFQVSIAAGIGAIGVAQFPVRPIAAGSCRPPPPGDTGDCFVSGFVNHPNVVHYLFAGLFFICILIFCLVLFPRGNGSQKNLVEANGRHYNKTVWSAKNRYFFWCGMIILGSLLALVLNGIAIYFNWESVTTFMDSYRHFLLFEITALLAFSAAWLKKGEAGASLLLISRRLQRINR